MKQSLSRRDFIKSGVAAAGALAISGPASSVAGQPEKGHVATLHDLSKCTGCGECVEACREQNSNRYPQPEKPFPRMYPDRVKIEDWSDKQEVRNRLTPYNWLFIQEADIKTDDGETTLYIPRRCMHCVNPPCVKLCPWGAAVQEKNGLSKINPAICLGGSKCKDVCPWDIPQRQTGTGLYLDILPSLAGNGVMYKCNRCFDRLSSGEEPACISECPEGVQTIGPRDDIIREAYRIAEETGGYVYGDKENGGTNTIYVSPVPIDTLNTAIEKGSGLPDLSPKKNAMADGNTLAFALFIAPFAGIAGAFTKLMALSRKQTRHEADNDNHQS